ncbi:MAG: hypothetical protein ACE5NN_03460 [Candidatus Bathyarchaeia archaeon]
MFLDFEGERRDEFIQHLYKEFYDLIKDRMREEQYFSVQDFIVDSARRHMADLGWFAKEKRIWVDKELADEFEKMAEERGVFVSDLVV